MSKKREKICGIYAIINKINNKKYIGQSEDIELRWKDHIRSLNGKYHCNRYLQHAWDKYGEINFEFVILEKCILEQLDEYEQKQIALNNSRFDQCGYNLNDGGQGTQNPIKEISIGHAMGMIGKSRRKNNTSKYVGVCFKNNRWEVSITPIGEKWEYLGRFKTEKDAALAYDKRALELYGKTFNFDVDYVKSCNFPEKTKQSSDYKGVSKRKGEDTIFRARIWLEKIKKSISLGGYEDEKLAAQNYDIAALYYRGEEAAINFPELLFEYLEFLKDGFRHLEYVLEAA